MHIILEHHELCTALHQYVETMGLPLEGKRIELELNAPRGSNEYTATVKLVDASQAKPTDSTVNPAFVKTSQPLDPDSEKDIPSEDTDVASEYTDKNNKQELFG